MNKEETLCWNCKRVDCEWLADHQAVPGWLIRRGKISIVVQDCPKFISSKLIPLTSSQIAKRTGISIRTIFRWKERGNYFLQKQLHEKGFKNISYSQRDGGFIDSNECQ